MSKKERITAIVFDAINEVNQKMPSEKQISRSLDTTLLGPLSEVDSLGLTFLIVATEKKINEEFQGQLTLAAEDIMVFENSPFRTVKTLIEYIIRYLEK